MPIFFTYDNTSLTDGFGAQLLRQMGIFSLSKFLRCYYVHAPIIETIEEFAHNVKNQEELDTLTQRVNEFFLLPSDSEPDNYDKVFTFRDVGFRKLIFYFLRYRFSHQNILIRILLPFGCIDRIPSIYKIAVDKIRERNFSKFSRHVRRDIVVHIRLGYGQKSKVAEHVVPRFLPLNYYSELLSNLTESDSIGTSELKAIIHTDLAPRNSSWHPTAKRLKQNLSFGEKIENGGEILVNGSDISDNFATISNLTVDIMYCEDFFNTFLDMACADVLIVSRSTFSYLAGLFNEGIVIWPDNHGHSKLSNWKKASAYGVNMNFRLIPG